jgi:hypothetical protein
MNKKILSNPITGKIIFKTNMKNISLVIDNFFPKIIKNTRTTQSEIFKKISKTYENITDEEYFVKIRSN